MHKLAIITAVAPDRADHLHETAQSVAQTRNHLNIQWIVVWDGVSTQPVEHADAQLTTGKLCSGASLARNTALPTVEAEYLLKLDADGNRSQAMRTVLMQGLLRHGVLAQSWVTCAAHSEADIDHTIEAIALSLDDYARALADGPESVLTGRPVAPSMRPYAAPRQITLTGPKRAGKPGGEGQGSLLSKEAGGNTVFEHAREHTRSREVR